MVMNYLFQVCADRMNSSEVMANNVPVYQLPAACMTEYAPMDSQKTPKWDFLEISLLFQIRKYQMSGLKFKANNVAVNQVPFANGQIYSKKKLNAVVF